MIGAPPVFLFEPHQPEQCEFRPQVLLDITSVWPKKYEAFKAMNEHWHFTAFTVGCAATAFFQASIALSGPPASAARAAAIAWRAASLISSAAGAACDSTTSAFGRLPRFAGSAFFADGFDPPSFFQ